MYISSCCSVTAVSAISLVVGVELRALSLGMALSLGDPHKHLLRSLKNPGSFWKLDLF